MGNPEPGLEEIVVYSRWVEGEGEQRVVKGIYMRYMQRLILVKYISRVFETELSGETAAQIRAFIDKIKARAGIPENNSTGIMMYPKKIRVLEESKFEEYSRSRIFVGDYYSRQHCDSANEIGICWYINLLFDQWHMADEKWGCPH